MSEEKTKKKQKSSLKCRTCQNYDKNRDFCVEKEIEDCSKQMSTNFSQCDSFLIHDKLVMF